MRVSILGKTSQKPGRIIFDTLETARAFGVRMQPRAKSAEVLEASVDFDPYASSIDHFVDAWLPLTFAFNSINRSMGVGDLYPFMLGAPTMLKPDLRLY
jgi:hypothetical protein